MNYVAVEFDCSDRATLESLAVRYFEQLGGWYGDDASNGLDQNANGTVNSAQNNHGRVQSRKLLGQAKEPVQVNDRDRGSPEVQETRQRCRQARWR